MSKPTPFPRKTALGGVKPFGHGKSSNPKKVLKYSVSVPRCLVDRKQHILKALGTSFRLFTPDYTFQLNVQCPKTLGCNGAASQFQPWMQYTADTPDLGLRNHRFQNITFHFGK